MRLLKKYFRLFLRAIFLLLFGITVYYLNLHYTFTQQRNRLFFAEDYVLKGPVAKFANDFNPSANLEIRRNVENKSKFEDLIFDEEDMVDENGRPFHIMIWNRRGGVPGYVANPKECLGNISCRVTYVNDDVDKAHAVVFPAGRSRELPNAR